MFGLFTLKDLSSGTACFSEVGNSEFYLQWCTTSWKSILKPSSPITCDEVFSTLFLDTSLRQQIIDC